MESNIVACVRNNISGYVCYVNCDICKVFAVSTTIFVIYSTICYRFFPVNNISNYIFTIAASLVFMAWFFAWGNHATEGCQWKSIYDEE